MFIKTKNIKIFSFFLLFLLVILATPNIIHYLFTVERIENNEYKIGFTLTEFEGLDSEYICKLIDCSSFYIIKSDRYYEVEEHKTIINGIKTSNNNYIRIKDEEKENKILNYKDKYFFTLNYKDHGNIKILIEFTGKIFYDIEYNDEQIIFQVNLKKEGFFLVIISTALLIISLILLFIYLNLKSENEKEIIIFKNISLEAKNSNKVLGFLVENLHHEMNSPVAVLFSKFVKLKRVLDIIEKNLNKNRRKTDKNICKDLRNDNLKLLNSLEEDFSLINISLEQTSSILERLRDLKDIRYSNGNKSLYELIKGTIDSILIMTSSSLEYFIDKDFEKYSINHNVINGAIKSLENGDFTLAISNHIKNSIEAGSSKVAFNDISIKNNLLSFNLMDDGNGMDNVVLKNAFEPNFSTKHKNGTIRGIGLYMNRSTIRDTSGDLICLETSNKGTTFRITVPFNKFKTS